MKEYNKPVIETEELELEDIIATSGKFGTKDLNDVDIPFEDLGF